MTKMDHNRWLLRHLDNLRREREGSDQTENGRSFNAAKRAFENGIDHCPLCDVEIRPSGLMNHMSKVHRIPDKKALETELEYRHRQEELEIALFRIESDKAKFARLIESFQAAPRLLQLSSEEGAVLKELVLRARAKNKKLKARITRTRDSLSKARKKTVHRRKAKRNKRRK